MQSSQSTASSSATPPTAATHSVSGPGATWVARYAQYLRNTQQVSLCTLEAYTLDLVMLSRWAIARQQDLVALNPADLALYVTQRLAQGTQRSTVARNISSLRRFYAFLVQQGLIAINPVRSLSVTPASRRAPELVPRDALRLLLQPSVREFHTSLAAYRARRDQAIVWTLYGTRLSISEVRLLRWDQIDEAAGVIRVPRSRGRLRACAIDPELLPVLSALHTSLVEVSYPEVMGAYCFPTSRGRPMTRQALCQIVRKWALDCGVETGVTPSALRWTGQVNEARQRRKGRAALVGHRTDDASAEAHCDR